ncbi:MAG: hypothetical protein JXC33_08045, partial [Deltaproteobacteria bacterium]|nr:hypothetical protein [Deltaproteobacteria bacterium]
RLKRSLQRECAAFIYKRATTLLWAVFVGGTGTGKSLCFNALCGADISETGVVRPKTEGPIVFVSESSRIGTFPFDDLELQRHDDTQGNSGAQGRFSVVEHERHDFKHVAVVDTPDLDSLEIANRHVAEVFYLLADIIIFIASQEKYADAVPSHFFQRVYREGKPYFLLINKASPELTNDDVIRFFHEQRVNIAADRLYLIPYMKKVTRDRIAGNSQFAAFEAAFADLCNPLNVSSLRLESERHAAAALSKKVDCFLGQVLRERTAAEDWLGALERLYEAGGSEIMTGLEQHYARTSRGHLQREIRKIFTKYDIFRKPRGYVIRFVTAPLRLFGIMKAKAAHDHSAELLKIRRKIDITPILLVMERFNRQVLENLSPEDKTAPLYREIRSADIVMTGDEIRARIEEEQEKLARWLDETFAEMARGISRTKEWGIYTTAILWGILIVSFEIVLGGGISILEAALDSIFAPFVTKGSAELFASREIKKIASELDERYRRGLLSILTDQKDRYAERALLLTASSEAVDAIRAFQHELGEIMV